MFLVLSFLEVDPDHGNMNLSFQIMMPGFDYDKAHPGRGDSHGWFFYTTYNTEEAYSLSSEYSTISAHRLLDRITPTFF